MPIRSYVRSTDYHRWCFAHREHRKPCGENVICGINVSVVVRPTFWTIPFPHIKRHLIDNVTAFPTALGTGKSSVNFNHRPTVPLALIFQLPNQFTPTRISNRLCKFVVLCAIRAPRFAIIMFFTAKSSTAIVWFSRTSRVVSLC